MYPPQARDRLQRLASRRDDSGGDAAAALKASFDAAGGKGGDKPSSTGGAGVEEKESYVRGVLRGVLCGVLCEVLRGVLRGIIHERCSCSGVCVICMWVGVCVRVVSVGGQCTLKRCEKRTGSAV